ncbi:MAG TPA: protein-glutamate O-methyltransferase CheR [Chthonomonadaceae bacterium]|nr:protein-glutamate O-methyltransferase CheR [Chthonomonadaceae bacterium]
MEEYSLSDIEFQRIRQLVYRLTGISLSDAKRQLVKSRLQKRLRRLNLSSFQAYYDYLIAQGDDCSERTEFINCITTNKTDFFREPHHFDFIAKKVIPPLVRMADQGMRERKLRIWHAGCSTGEEPYTLAMTLDQALDRQGNWDWRQLASDIDTGVLAHAERGVYERERITPVPKALLHRYFLSGTGEQADFVRVKQELRDHIAFRQINLLDNSWPFSPGFQFDIIFCRNVVIYFDKPTQKRLFARYQDLLKPGGYLFIGHSESLLGISEAFDSLGHTIYRLPERPVERAKAA